MKPILPILSPVHHYGGHFARFIGAFLVLMLVGSTPAAAQVRFELLGARALGMAGAFVAVADDATAFHWNPAGTVKGGPISVTVGWDDLQFGDSKAPPFPGAASGQNLLTAVSGSPLGVSYGYMKLAQVVAVREDGTAVVESLTIHHLGGTISWPLFKGFSVGGTGKYLRGQAAIGETFAFTADEVLNQGLDFEGPKDGAFDVDAGFMAEFGPIKGGVTFKNLLQPTFVGDSGIAIQLKRLIRLGIAVIPTDGLTLAFDMDLDTADPLVGLRRMMAVGGETRLGSSFALRGGVRWSREGEWRPIGAVGASWRIYKGSWLDGYATYSRSDDRGWGIALRAGS